MWIDTWLTILLVMGWIIPGLIATGGAGPAWVTAGAVVIAVVTPPVTYRYAQAIARRLLYRLDPPTDMERTPC